MYDMPRKKIMYDLDDSYSNELLSFLMRWVTLIAQTSDIFFSVCINVDHQMFDFFFWNEYQTYST